MNKFSSYTYLMLLILAVEIFIALYVRDSFIRPYFGDFLATIFVYTLIRAFATSNFYKALLVSLLISYGVEFLQAIDILSLVGIRSNTVLATVAGTSFDWGDMLAYTLGGIAIVFFEIKINHLKLRKNETIGK